MVISGEKIIREVERICQTESQFEAKVMPETPAEFKSFLDEDEKWLNVYKRIASTASNGLPNDLTNEIIAAYSIFWRVG